MTFPNFLSAFRLIGTFFFLFFVIRERYNIAFIIFVLQGLSDLMDGLIARTFKSKTTVGAFLDPLADKFMLVSSYLILTYKNIIPQWITLLVVLRDSFVLLGFIVLYRISNEKIPHPRVLGKVCTAIQAITIAYVLWSKDDRLRLFFFYPTVILTITSGLDYLFASLRLFVRYKPMRS
ncbi:MAG: CDP-alcohol phosphatidyltransferase family protein [Deltaproteobacteria bacterium]|nr:CDP-alcohol phosphatidyltransferase family protein [Deltaproteobacteria bacterium]